MGETQRTRPYARRPRCPVDAGAFPKVRKKAQGAKGEHIVLVDTIIHAVKERIQIGWEVF